MTASFDFLVESYYSKLCYSDKLQLQRYVNFSQVQDVIFSLVRNVIFSLLRGVILSLRSVQCDFSRSVATKILSILGPRGFAYSRSKTSLKFLVVLYMMAVLPC